MGHTIAEKEKLLQSVQLLKEQLAAMENGFRDGITSADTLKHVAKSRALINGLMADVLEDHLRIHVLQDDCVVPAGAHAAAEELIGVVHAYMGR